MSNLVALGECTDRCLTWNPAADDPDGEFVYIDLSSVDNDTKRIRSISPMACSTAPSRARQIVKAGDILVSNVRPNLNGVAIVPIELDGATASTGYTVLRPSSDRIDSLYLLHWVKHPEFVGEMVRLATGASYPAISDKIVRAAMIPLPSLSEQRRIAATLEKADALRAKRREAIATLDQMIQSVFTEIFGDPVTNPKGWPMEFFGEVCENSFRNGLSPSTSGSVPGKVLTLSAITRQRFQSHHQKEAFFDRPPSDNQKVKMDTFLICRGNGNRQLVGVGVFPSHDLYDVCFPDTMIGANIAKDRASPRFIEQIWGSRLVRNQIESGASTTNGTFKINQRTLEKILIPIPPRELQEQFEIISTKMMAMQVKMSKHSDLIDENFCSLQHRMFGEF